MRFDLPKDHTSIIKVIGVGGGGSNAVNYMYEQGIKGVDFIVCNTDAQALDKSPVPFKIQLGATLTSGRGAGSIPEVGRNAAVENLDDVKELLSDNTTMVFVTAGMGGGTGTGAAPVIAKAAKDLGILTVGIVTVPFIFEGKRRSHQAEEGLKQMRDAVDTLLVIRNDKLRELYGNQSLKKAFGHADEVLCTAAKGIAEVITLTGEINVDMNDVNTVMRNSGVAIMGSGTASGEGRAMAAVTQALESPLLNDNDITGANFVLLNITYGNDEVLMDEIMEITDYIQEMAGMSAEVIWGYGGDESLEEDLCVTVIATGFKANSIDAGLPQEKVEPVKKWLNDDQAVEVTQKISKPTDPTSTPSDKLIDVGAQEEAEPFLKSTTDEPTQEQAPTADTPSEDRIVHQLDADAPAEAPASMDFQPDLFEPVNPTEVTQESLQHTEVTENEAPKTNSPVYYDLNSDDLTPSTPEEVKMPEMQISGGENTPPREERPSRQELQSKNRERENRIKEYTLRLKTPSGLTDLESEPAYKRRDVTLDKVSHSSESNASRYTLSEETDATGEKKVQLRDNNPFLHDNVD